MNDPAEEICDALVAYVGGLGSPDVSLVAAVRKTDNPLGELQLEHTDLTVLLFASSESAEKRGRGNSGPWLEEYTIAVLIVRKMDAEFTRAKLAKYVRELNKAVRGVKMSGYTFGTYETPIKLDADVRKTTGQFCSAVHYVYEGMC